jgi:hypothetical protein
MTCPPHVWRLRSPSFGVTRGRCVRCLARGRWPSELPPRRFTDGATPKGRAIGSLHRHEPIEKSLAR